MLNAVDFSRSGARTPAAGWLLLILGALALAGTEVLDRRATRQIGAAEAALAHREETNRRNINRTAKPVQANPVESRARHAEEEARTPWLATLRSIESLAAAPVYLHSLVLDPAARVIRIEAEAPSFKDALSFVKAVDEEPLLRPASLASHEVAVDNETTKQMVRFNVVAQWTRQ